MLPVPILMLGLLTSGAPQDPIVPTSGRDRGAEGQVVSTTGTCGDTPVSVAIKDSTADIWVSYGAAGRWVTQDVFALETGDRGRYVARTFVMCRSGGDGLSVHLLFADARSGELLWAQGSFKVDAQLDVSDVRHPEARTDEEAANNFY